MVEITAETLAGIELFRSLPADDRKALAGCCHPHRYAAKRAVPPPNCVVFSELPNRFMWAVKLLLYGEARVYCSIPPPTRRHSVGLCYSRRGFHLLV